MHVRDVAAVSYNIRTTSSINRKIEILQELWAKSGNSLPYVAELIAGERKRIGVGYATLLKAYQSSGTGSGLDVDEFFTSLEEISRLKGEGSEGKKTEVLIHLFSKCTLEEKDFLFRYFLSDLRQGASVGVVLKSLARFFDADEKEVKKEYALQGSVKKCVESLMKGEHSEVVIFQPLQPMLGYQAETVEDGLKECGLPAVCDFKVDGIRIQFHKRGKKWKVFSRNLRDITEFLPELSSLTDVIKANEVILDGEVQVKDRAGKPLPFQDLMSVLSQKEHFLFRNVEVNPYFFDVLFMEENLMDAPVEERKEKLNLLLPEEFVMPSLYLEEEVEVKKWMKRSLEEGHEGIVLKKIGSPYQPGKRSKDWIKVKRFFTLDVVILAAEWGHGRRSNWLSNYHLGVRKGKKFVMVGKTFKGLTDKEFEVITTELLKIKTFESGNIVYVTPRIVVEVAFDEVQKSPRYDSGYALRFARIKSIRWDKDVEVADSIEEVERIYRFFRERKGSG